MRKLAKERDLDRYATLYQAVVEDGRLVYSLDLGVHGEEGITEVWVDAREAENGHVAIVVSDSGPGVPDGLVQRIFNPFFTTKDRAAGVGLALAAAAALAIAAFFGFVASNIMHDRRTADALGVA